MEAGRSPKLFAQDFVQRAGARVVSIYNRPIFFSPFMHEFSSAGDTLGPAALPFSISSIHAFR